MTNEERREEEDYDYCLERLYTAYTQLEELRHASLQVLLPIGKIPVTSSEAAANDIKNNVDQLNVLVENVSKLLDETNDIFDTAARLSRELPGPRPIKHQWGTLKCNNTMEELDRVVYNDSIFETGEEADLLDDSDVGSELLPPIKEDLDLTLSMFKDIYADVHVESESEDLIRVEISNKLQFMIVLNREEGDKGQIKYFAICIGPLTIHNEISKFLRLSEHKTSLRLTLEMIQSYYSLFEAPCQSCGQLVDKHGMLPIARYFQLHESINKFDWTARHKNCI